MTLRRSHANLVPLAFVGGAALLALAFVLSVTTGAAGLPLARVVGALVAPDESTESLIVWTLRLPRAVVAVVAGACLAVAGGVMQGVTRNPLASPGILGVNAGAAFAILVMVVFFPSLPQGLFVPLAFAGGLAAAGLVFLVATSVGITPLRLALSGVAVAALFAAGSNTLAILFESRAQAALFSLAGSVAGRTWVHANLVVPWAAVALTAAVLSAGLLNLLALGDDVASALGVRLGLARLWLTAVAVLLAAAAVSVVGPVGFVGLVVPHLARGLVGPDYRLVVPLSVLLGGTLLTLADVGARLVDAPAETPVGIVVAALGAPFFVYLARRVGRADS